jgi:hypothetical protein
LKRDEAVTITSNESFDAGRATDDIFAENGVVDKGARGASDMSSVARVTEGEGKIN